MNTKDQQTYMHLLGPFLERPKCVALVLSVDEMAPVLSLTESDDAPRSLLAQLADRFGTVACISARTAEETRQRSGSFIWALGLQGAERLKPGSEALETDERLLRWVAKASAVRHRVCRSRLLRAALGVRSDARGPVLSLNWESARWKWGAALAAAPVRRTGVQDGFATVQTDTSMELWPDDPVVHRAVGLSWLIRTTRPELVIYMGGESSDIGALAELSQLVSHREVKHVLRVGVHTSAAPLALPGVTDTVVTLDSLANILWTLVSGQPASRVEGERP
jgi:hypothetical protein